jgi:hypothetical protein
MTGIASLGDTALVGRLDTPGEHAPLSLAAVGLQMRATSWTAQLVGEQRLDRRDRRHLPATRPARQPGHRRSARSQTRGNEASAASTFSCGYS